MCVFVPGAHVCNGNSLQAAMGGSTLHEHGNTEGEKDKEIAMHMLLKPGHALV